MLNENGRKLWWIVVDKRCHLVCMRSNEIGVDVKIEWQLVERSR
jgi:hypothetical protein